MKSKNFKVGEYVRIVERLLSERFEAPYYGKIMNIDGAYHFVNDLNNPEIMWELYSSEIETATDEEVTLWLLEH